MSHIEDKSIDMILCDLPYGVTAPKWDEHIDIKSLWEHYNRVIKKDGTIALFSAQPFTTKIIASNEKDFRYCWYWIKNQATNFFHAKRKYYPQITDGHIPTNSAKGCSNGKTYHGTNKRNYEGGKTTRYPNNVLDFKCVDNYSRVHSSEKPIELLEYLIKTYTNEGDMVMDNCFGSASTAIACEKSNRKFVGMEKDNEIFTSAIRRVSAYCGLRCGFV
jgi:site-specific DNA-methyltransferase (adenine-specific)